MSTPVEISDARRVTFDGLIDYAGLFPPADLDMAGAVAGFRSARSSDRSWMVDRFVVPASRLGELAAALASTMTAGEDPWRLSVIADAGDWPGLTDSHRVIAAFGDELGPAAVVELAEIRLPPEPDELDVGDVAVDFVGKGAVPFFEMPPGELPLPALAAARRQRDVAVGAKLRCGGVTADLFPSPQRVVDFVAGCAELGLPFKCTAGLHHPVRHVDPETGFTHHGFLNIATASAAAGEVRRDDLLAIVGEEDPAAFGVLRSGLVWRGHSFDTSAVAAARSRFIGYGSCDFDEPVADLESLGMLP